MFSLKVKNMAFQILELHNVGLGPTLLADAQ